MKKVIILQHVPNEGAGTILEYLKTEKIPFETIQLWKKESSFPHLNDVGALIVMGGPMNVYDEDKYSFLKEEDRFIKEAVKRGVPYLGICLGAQLLAKALGARVYKAKQEELGWQGILLSDQAGKNALFKEVNHGALTVFQWHGDTFDLPKRSVHLASSEIVPNQAFELGSKFFGLQFHIEVTYEMLKEWFKNHPDSARIFEGYTTYGPAMNKLASRIYENFFELSKISIL